MPNKKVDGESLVIELTDEVKEQMAKDPELAAVLRDVMATFRQAQQLVHDGKYATFDEAMAGLGHPTQPFDD